MPQILGITGRGNRSKLSGLRSEKQSYHGKKHQNDSKSDDISNISVGNAHVNDISHQKRYEHLHKYFQRHKNRRQYRLPLILADRTK